MECPNCQLTYSDEGNERVPRILNNCGHSLCEKCISLLFSANQITCPVCEQFSEATDIKQFTKNLALLNL